MSRFLSAVNVTIRVQNVCGAHLPQAMVVKPGQILHLQDGAIMVEVTEVDPGKSVTGLVRNGGTLGERKVGCSQSLWLWLWFSICACICGCSCGHYFGCSPACGSAGNDN